MKNAQELAVQIVYGNPRWTEDKTLVERIAQAIQAERERARVLVEACEKVLKTAAMHVASRDQDGCIHQFIAADALSAFRGDT